jgi:hypothetical protein
VGKQDPVRSRATVAGSEVTAAIRRASAPVPGPTSGAGVTCPDGGADELGADEPADGLPPLVAAGLAVPSTVLVHPVSRMAATAADARPAARGRRARRALSTGTA